MLRHPIACILLALALVGCGSAGASLASTRSLGPGERWLAAVDWTGRACGGVGLVGDAFRLHGSPSDAHLAWMTWSDGSRRELVWNPGTSARFVPSLEVIDPNGTVIAREGSIVTGYCLVGDPKYPNALFVEFAPSPGFATPTAPGTSGDIPTASPATTRAAASPSAVAIGPCRTADLLVSVTNTGGGAGNVGGYLLFENTTAEACTLQGAPTLTAVTVAGTATPARIAATVGTPFPSLTQPPLVILEPGDKAFAAYGGSDNPGSVTATCPPPYHTFQVTPPGNTISVDLPAFNSWLDQDQPSCAGIDVSVIAPASEVELFTDLSSLRP